MGRRRAVHVGGAGSGIGRGWRVGPKLAVRALAAEREELADAVAPEAPAGGLRLVSAMQFEQVRMSGCVTL